MELGGHPAEVQSARRPVQEHMLASPTSVFGLFPNPARNWVTFNYTLASATDQGRIIVRDLSGRTLETIRFSGQEGQRVLDTRDLVAGVYTVEFLNGSDLLRTEKLIIEP